MISPEGSTRARREAATTSTNPRGAVKYYASVDGLRAIAVMSVVFYHVGLSWLPGGYVGVDVFFVISGFLIIGHIVEQRQKGTFRYREFWARRVVRILPPYLLVVLATLAASFYFMVTPEEVQALGKQAMYSAMMVVNHHFLSMEGYFDTSAELKPFLHLWSLSVEEQFYLVTPLLLGLFWAGTRWMAGKARVALGWTLATIVFAASLYLCIRYTGAGEKNYAFYLMPLRGWEFVLGGATHVLVPPLRRLPRALLGLGGWIGLGLIAWAVFGFGIGTQFPGWHAVIPTVGAAMVIGTSIAAPQTPVARALAVKPMVWIGLLSYSWYLWHWPLIVYARIYNFESLPLVWGLGAAFGSLLLAWLTYKFIEIPTRVHWQPITRVAGLRIIATGLAACVLVACAGYLLSTKRTEQMRTLVQPRYRRGHATSGGKCRIQNLKGDACARQIASARGGEDSNIGLLFGDSHARALTTALTRRAVVIHDAYLVTSISSGCVPIFGVVRHWSDSKRMDGTCQKSKERSLRALRKGTVKMRFAIISAFWRNYPLLSEDGVSPASDQDEFFIKQMQNTLEVLKGAGVERILIVGPAPFLAAENPSSCILRAIRYGVDVAGRCGTDTALHEQRNAIVVRRLQAAISGKDWVHYIEPSEALCSGGACSPVIDGLLRYRDDDHLNDSGVALLYEHFRPDFEWVMAKAGDGSRDPEARSIDSGRPSEE